MFDLLCEINVWDVGGKTLFWKEYLKQLFLRSQACMRNKTFRILLFQNSKFGNCMWRRFVWAIKCTHVRITRLNYLYPTLIINLFINFFIGLSETEFCMIDKKCGLSPEQSLFRSQTSKINTLSTVWVILGRKKF